MSANRANAGPAVIGHRGASAARPENTIAAFAHAKALGADGIELDVRSTADGVLVVHHDACLADGRPIIATVWAELPDAVATLADALEAAAGITVNVEIKSSPRDPDHLSMPDTVAAVVDELTAHVEDGGHLGAELLVTSFDPDAVALVHELGPDLPVGQLVFDASVLAERMAAVAELGGVTINPWDPLVDATLVRAAHARGLAVNVWTVDDPQRLRALADLGVDGLITNVPDIARAIVDTRATDT